MCQAAILHWWVSNRQQALYTNRLLNFGNEQLKTFRTDLTTPASTASGIHQADAFWTVPPNFMGMLAFNYPKADLPADFQPGLHIDSRRRSEGYKRRLPESSLASHQHQKKYKAGSSRQRQQLGEGAGGKRHVHAPELSSKLQQRLATFLDLIAKGIFPAGPAGVKLVRRSPPTWQSSGYQLRHALLACQPAIECERLQPGQLVHVQTMLSPTLPACAPCSNRTACGVQVCRMFASMSMHQRLVLSVLYICYSVPL